MYIARQRFDEAGTLPPPDVVEIESTLGCNLRCIMCHVSYMDEKAKMLDLSALRSIDFIKGKDVIIGSVFEPTIHPEFNRLIDIFNRNENRIEVITNGTRLNRVDIPALYDSNFSSVVFSFDGIRKATYEKIRRNANFERTLENIVQFREIFSSRDVFFAVNSVMMRSNIDESWETVDFWDRHNIDQLRLIFMVVRDANPALVRESLWPIRDHAFRVLDEVIERLITEKRRLTVRSPWFSYSTQRARYPTHFAEDALFSEHPGRRFPPATPQKYQLGAGYGMSFPCKSPFTFARILWDGSVELCKKYVVGNLNKESFEDIWYGQKAFIVRETLKRREDVCNACEYFKLCLRSKIVDVTRKEYYVYGPLQAQLEKINFDTGELAA